MSAIEQLRNKLAEIKKIRGLSARLARAAGVEPTTVSEWQRGGCLPSFDKLDAIASVLGVTVGELFMGSHEGSSGRAVPLLVSSLKGTVRDATNSSQARASERTSLQHVARFTLEQLDEDARMQVFVDFVPEAEGYPRRKPRRRAVVRSDDSQHLRSRRGQTA